MQNKHIKQMNMNISDIMKLLRCCCYMFAFFDIFFPHLHSLFRCLLLLRQYKSFHTSFVWYTYFGRKMSLSRVNIQCIALSAKQRTLMFDSLYSAPYKYTPMQLALIFPLSCAVLKYLGLPFTYLIEGDRTNVQLFTLGHFKLMSNLESLQNHPQRDQK